MRNRLRAAVGSLLALTAIAGLSGGVSAQQQPTSDVTGTYRVRAICEQTVDYGVEQRRVYRYLAYIQHDGRALSVRLNERGKPADEYSLYLVGRLFPTRPSAFLRHCGGEYWRRELMLISDIELSESPVKFSGESIINTREYPENLGVTISANCDYTFVKLNGIEPDFPECGIEEPPAPGE